MGKTTLTRHLYHHERSSAHFGDKRIWICASKNIDVIRLLNEMVESFTSSKSKLSNIDAIIKKLKEDLNEKKLLLVLDDVWNYDHDSWSCLKGLLHKIGTIPGSVILINTRSDDVAKAAGAVFKHKLEGLSPNKSWSLLYQIVSDNGNQPIDNSLEEVGKRIVEKCKGVPLAIAVIGHFMQSKHYLHEWEAVEKSELSDLPPVRNKILSSLLLSFNHLPSPSTKQCFAYCAIIPKGSCMFKNELIGLWSSQGYLCDDQRRNMTTAEIGEENLKILLSNLLLECVSTEFGIVGYRTHELVYDLAANACGSYLIKDAKDLGGIGSCRHLIINSVESKVLSDNYPEIALTKLRTLSLKGTAIPLDVLIHTRYLRTLMLDRTGITELPPAVALLKHLRFLDASHNPISTLPDSLGELYQLQTLIIHSCDDMVKLPKVVNKLVNLRHISTTVPMFAWKGLTQLTNLQSLPCLSLDDDGDGWTIDELGNLHELRDEIHILGLEYVKDKEESKKAGLAGKVNVTKLNLSWVEPKGRRDFIGGDCDEDVLEGLEPHPNITSIEVRNFNGVGFPRWITEMAVLAKGGTGGRTPLKNLTTVKLLNCTRCHTLPKLGQLPLLKILILRGLYVEYVGIEFYGGDDLDKPEAVSFQCLRELNISRFPRLTTWREPPKASFPRLETLRITDCNLLESVPIIAIKSLTILELRNLNNIESLDIIKYSLGLTSLIMNMLPKIESLPHELADCWNLQSDFHKLASMPGLELLFNLKSKVVKLRNISTVAPMVALNESQQLANAQSLPLVALNDDIDDEDGSTIHELEDLHPLSGDFSNLGPECAKAEDQVGKSIESAKDVEHARNSLECVNEMDLAGTSMESAKGKDHEFREVNNTKHVKDDEQTGKILESLSKELVGITLECVKDNELVGKNLEDVIDKEITDKTIEGVKEEELSGKSLEGVKDNEISGRSIERVNDKELTGKILESVKDKKIAGKGLEGVEEKEIKGESVEGVEDEDYGVAWWTKVNNSKVEGNGLQQLTNLGEFGDELHISGLEYVKNKEKARNVGLAGKANVTKLKLVWAAGRGETSEGVWDEDVLESLEPHPNITSLEVQNFLGVKFPPWIMEAVKFKRLENLTEVKLLNCSRCQTLPALGHLPLLKSLVLGGFDVEIIGVEFYGYYDLRRDLKSPFLHKLTKWWVPQEVSFRSLHRLEIRSFLRLTTWSELPKEAFPCLNTLEVKDCRRLKSVPAMASKALRVLMLENLDSVRSLDFIKSNRGLEYLLLDELHNIESLPEELAYCTKLLKLRVNGAHKLSHMSIRLKSLARLRSITVYDCPLIDIVMDDILHLRSSLSDFLIYECPSLKNIPSGLEECTLLENLVINTCLTSEGSPINISKLLSLRALSIDCSSAEHLRSVLESAKYLRSLGWLQIGGFRDENEMEDYFSDITPFLHLLFLSTLILYGHPNIKKLPQKLGCLTQINTLEIQQFEDLEEIPAWIGDLSSLSNLQIHDCKNMKNLPSKDALKSLVYLGIWRCRLLVERCAKDEGPEWQNIAHIPRIEIDDKIIQDLE